MKLKYILIYGNLIFVLNVTAQINSADQVRIDSLFEQWNNKDSPGAAIGIIEKGKLIYTRGYGIADLEHGIPITASSVFYLGSVSKQFVTMCILLLEEQGKLNLDDEIQLYLPDFPKYQAPLTIRHFIHHTSGVRDNLTLWELAGNDLLDHIDDDAIYQLIKRQKILNFTPGDKYLYSNSCYFMLAMIVEKASDLPIKEFADKNIFIPLGMENSHFHDNHYHIIKNRVFSYSRVDGGYNNLIMRFDLVGSGGLYSRRGLPDS
ncbi:serine hydrolase [candidate division KSB1 bacterium]|nr:serine hydrolase [candidate division KSB1 bacterium]